MPLGETGHKQTEPKLTPTTRISRWLLGPSSSFRNANRTWLYLAFILIVVALVALLGDFKT